MSDEDLFDAAMIEVTGFLVEARSDLATKERHHLHSLLWLARWRIACAMRAACTETQRAIVRAQVQLLENIESEVTR